MLSYLFTPIPGSSFNYYIPLLIFAVLLFLTGTAGKRLISKDKALRKSVGQKIGTLTWMGLSLALTLGLRHERIPYFSMRILMFIVLVITFIVLGKILYTYIRVYPKIKARIDTPKEQKKTYLPHKKRR
jgi:hypothetical protein